MNRSSLTLVLPQLRSRLAERLLDQRAMLLGADLSPEEPTRREDDHRRELAAELRERLIVELSRVEPPRSRRRSASVFASARVAAAAASAACAVRSAIAFASARAWASSVSTSCL